MNQLNIALENWPAWLPWAAILHNGRCYLFEDEPILDLENKHWGPIGTYCIALPPHLYSCVPWTESKTKRNEK